LRVEGERADSRIFDLLKIRYSLEIVTMHYASHLGKDKIMKKLIKVQGEMILELKKNAYMHLCFSILGQQLSVKVAAVIRKRFIDLYSGKFPEPQELLNTPATSFRSIGFSNAKASYVHNVARFALMQGMDDKKLKKMNDKQIIEYLTQIKGVGRWTTEMLLMFTLKREDVFAVDDLGIQVAMTGLYKLDSGDKKKMKMDMLTIAEQWSPYRTYACLYLWGWKDGD
jgi:DNA-3-methyladenine glycosylase II